ncbi:uncharacterized protein LOC103148640 isoform X1 [Poecilia formosa]|uniref:uncharacterized protein LOC103148640 isoform X1 n=1 Tax=Poecilia formosa TaxID=48698 RepID=UPI0007B82C88|nr:PREDICTED: uncharacterized protein LOC103148640 isoform X1 [Poecilia formosa]
MAERFPASPGSSEPDSPRGLNRGCLLEPAEDLFSDLSVIVPETPSPQLGKRRRHRRTAEDLYSPGPQVATGGSPGPEKSIGAGEGFSLKSKRRRLVDPSVGFVPASSLRSFPLGGWLEAPSSSSSSSSSSSLSYSSNSSSVSYLTPESVLRSNQIDASASASPPAAASSSSSLSFLTDEERKWLNEGQGDASLDVVEQIVISDDEEATVRSLQMKEDEALARSLQAQFDHEESLSRHHHHSHHLHHHQQSHQRCYSYVQPSWMSQVLAAVSPLVGFEDDLIGQHMRRGRGRRRSRLPDFAEDLQGNDYEVRNQPEPNVVSEQRRVFFCCCFFLSFRKVPESSPQSREPWKRLVSVVTAVRGYHDSFLLLSGSPGVRRAAGRRCVKENESQGNPEVSNQKLLLCDQQREHPVSDMFLRIR